MNDQSSQGSLINIFLCEVEDWGIKTAYANLRSQGLTAKITIEPIKERDNKSDNQDEIFFA